MRPFLNKGSICPHRWRRRLQTAPKHNPTVVCRTQPRPKLIGPIMSKNQTLSQGTCSARAGRTNLEFHSHMTRPQPRTAASNDSSDRVADALRQRNCYSAALQPSAINRKLPGHTARAPARLTATHPLPGSRRLEVYPRLWAHGHQPSVVGM